MASQSRLSYNNQIGTLGATMWPASTEIIFGQIPNFATITGSDYIPLIIDPGAINEEVVWLVAYTAGSNVGTIWRSLGEVEVVPEVPDFFNHTSGNELPQFTHYGGAGWLQGPTQSDFQKVNFSVYRAASGLTIPGGSTWGPLTYDTLDFSTGGANGIAAYIGTSFTPYTPGYYMICARMTVGTSVAPRTIISIWKNGNEEVSGTDLLASFATGYTVQGIVFLDGNDYFEIEGYSTGSGPITVSTTTPALTRMSATLVMPG